MRIIEPKEFDKNFFRAAIGELERARTDEILRAGLNGLIAAADFSFPGEDRGMFESALVIARNCFALVVGCLQIYTGEAGERAQAIRETWLSPRVASPELFRRRTGLDYDRLHDNERADMHLSLCADMIEERLRAALAGLVAPGAPPEAQARAIAAARGDDIFNIPLESRPELIGFLYAQSQFSIVMLEQKGLAQGESAEEIRDARDLVWGTVLAGLGAPCEPGRKRIASFGRPTLN